MVDLIATIISVFTVVGGLLVIASYLNDWLRKRHKVGATLLWSYPIWKLGLLNEYAGRQVSGWGFVLFIRRRGLMVGFISQHPLPSESGDKSSDIDVT